MSKRSRRERATGQIRSVGNPLVHASELQQTVLQIVRAEMFSGPLPHHEHLARYEDLLPGLANRIVVMAESNAIHRQGLEKTVVEGNVAAQALGQNYAFVLAVLILLTGAVLLFLDKTSLGLWLILGDVTALAVVFLTGRLAQAKERKQRRQELEEGVNPPAR